MRPPDGNHGEHGRSEEKEQHGEARGEESKPSAPHPPRAIDASSYDEATDGDFTVKRPRNQRWRDRKAAQSSSPPASPTRTGASGRQRAASPQSTQRPKGAQQKPKASEGSPRKKGPTGSQKTTARPLDGGRTTSVAKKPSVSAFERTLYQLRDCFNKGADRDTILAIYARAQLLERSRDEEAGMTFEFEYKETDEKHKDKLFAVLRQWIVVERADADGLKERVAVVKYITKASGQLITPKHDWLAVVRGIHAKNDVPDTAPSSPTTPTEVSADNDVDMPLQQAANEHDVDKSLWTAKKRPTSDAEIDELLQIAIGDQHANQPPAWLKMTHGVETHALVSCVVNAKSRSVLVAQLEGSMRLPAVITYEGKLRQITDITEQYKVQNEAFKSDLSNIQYDKHANRLLFQFRQQALAKKWEGKTIPIQGRLIKLKQVRTQADTDSGGSVKLTEYEFSLLDLDGRLDAMQLWHLLSGLLKLRVTYLQQEPTKTADGAIDPTHWRVVIDSKGCPRELTGKTMLSWGENKLWIHHRAFSSTPPCFLCFSESHTARTCRDSGSPDVSKVKTVIGPMLDVGDDVEALGRLQAHEVSRWLKQKARQHQEMAAMGAEDTPAGEFIPTVKPKPPSWTKRVSDSQRKLWPILRGMESKELGKKLLAIRAGVLQDPVELRRHEASRLSNAPPSADLPMEVKVLQRVKAATRARPNAVIVRGQAAAYTVEFNEHGGIVSLESIDYDKYNGNPSTVRENSSPSLGGDTSSVVDAVTCDCGNKPHEREISEAASSSEPAQGTSETPASATVLTGAEALCSRSTSHGGGDGEAEQSTDVLPRGTEASKREMQPVRETESHSHSEAEQHAQPAPPQAKPASPLKQESRTKPSSDDASDSRKPTRQAIKRVDVDNLKRQSRERVEQKKKADRAKSTSRSPRRRLSSAGGVSGNTHQGDTTQEQQGSAVVDVSMDDASAPSTIEDASKCETPGEQANALVTHEEAPTASSASAVMATASSMPAAAPDIADGASSNCTIGLPEATPSAPTREERPSSKSPRKSTGKRAQPYDKRTPSVPTTTDDMEPPSFQLLGLSTGDKPPPKQLSLAQFCSEVDMSKIELKRTGETEVQISDGQSKKIFERVQLLVSGEDVPLFTKTTEWLDYLSARAIDVPDNGHCYYFSIYVAKTGDRFSSPLQLTDWTVSEAKFYREGSNATYQALVGVDGVWLANGTLQWKQLYEKHVGSHIPDDPVLAIQLVRCQIAKAVHADPRVWVDREFWGGPEEVMATVAWLREPIYVMDVAVDGTATTTAYYLALAKDGTETVLQKTLPPRTMVEHIHAHLRHEVLPTILLLYRRQGKAGSTPDHFNAMRFEEEAYTKWNRQNAAGEDMKARRQHVLRDLGLYVPPLEEPSQDSRRPEVFERMAEPSDANEVVEILDSSSEYSPSSADDSTPLSPPITRSDDVLWSKYEELVQFLDRTNAELKADTTWRLTSSANDRHFRKWRSSSTKFDAETRVRLLQRDTQLQDASTILRTLPRVWLDMMRSLPYPEVALARVPEKLLSHYGKALLCEAHEQVVAAAVGRTPSAAAQEVAALWKSAVRSATGDSKWSLAYGNTFWHRVTQAGGIFLKRPGLPGATPPHPELSHDGGTAPPATPDSEWTRLVAILLCCYTTMPAEWQGESLELQCVRVLQWLDTPQNQVVARDTINELRYLNWSSVRHILCGHGQLNLINMEAHVAALGNTGTPASVGAPRS